MSIQMKEILKENRSYLLLIIVLIICNLLIGCGEITTTFYFISATSGAGGQINPERAIMISEGGSQVFTITPDECYQIYDILVDGTSKGHIYNYTFEDVQQNHTIQDSFIIPGPIVHNADTAELITISSRQPSMLL